MLGVKPRYKWGKLLACFTEIRRGFRRGRALKAAGGNEGALPTAYPERVRSMKRRASSFMIVPALISITLLPGVKPPRLGRQNKGKVAGKMLSLLSGDLENSGHGRRGEDRSHPYNKRGGAH